MCIRDRIFFLCKKKSLRVCTVDSVRIELAKLMLVGTRITYQATGDAGYSIFPLDELDLSAQIGS